MAKLSALRWLIGIGVGLLLIAGVWLSLGSSRGSQGTNPPAIYSFFTGDEYGGELRELGFLREALERIEVELQQKTNGSALASLRTEQEAVMQRARQVASRVPVDRLPRDFSALITPQTAAPPIPVVAPAPVAVPVVAPGIAVRSIDEATPIRAAGELSVGLGPPSPVADVTSLALDTRSSWLLFIGPKEPRHAAPAPSAASGSGAGDRAETRPSAAPAERPAAPKSSTASLNRAEMRAPTAAPLNPTEIRPSSR
jgi:hypothetical protein